MAVSAIKVRGQHDQATGPPLRQRSLLLSQADRMNQEVVRTVSAELGPVTRLMARTFVVYPPQAERRRVVRNQG